MTAASPGATRTKCSSCGKRIRVRHPHVEVVNHETRDVLLRSHGAVACQVETASRLATMGLQPGVYILRHFHTCQDPDPRSSGCEGGCFTGLPSEADNTNERSKTNDD